MRMFPNKTTGCVLVIGWQADAIAALLTEHTPANTTHYIVTDQPKRLARATHLQHIHADLNDLDDIKAVFTQLAKRGQHPELVIFQARPAAQTSAEYVSNAPAESVSYEMAQLEQRWQQTGFRLFLWAQAAIAVLQDTAKQRRPATFVTLGADLASQPDASLAVDSGLYAGMRALMQSLAREFQPQSVHVAYVGLAAQSSSAAAAQLCWQLHQQPRSAWTHEVVLVS